MRQVDYIIVGQGLAGTVLAYTLLKAGKKVVIIDDKHQSSASKVAAGLYNPVVFKRLVESWKVDDLLPCMNDFYESVEKLVQKEFYFKKPIVRFFSEEQEKVLWQKKQADNVGKYLNPEIKDAFMPEAIQNNAGCSETVNSGNLRMDIFIPASSNFFLEKEILLQVPFEMEKLKVEVDKVSYKDLQAHKIIFCEGYKSINNPYFSWLPFKLTKGEIFTIHAPALQQMDKVVNKGVFILPLGENLYKVGATYEWEKLTLETSEEGKKELQDKLNKVIKVPYEIVKHEAGIRPTVRDRRPLIGLHPHHKSLAIFNGLGTKGVMLAPYFAQQLTGLLLQETPIDSEASITRLKKDLNRYNQVLKKEKKKNEGKKIEKS